MKKTNLFFIKLLVIIALFSFSGTSSAYDLPKWASKPVQWAKHVAQWFGYDDKDENGPANTTATVVEKASETPANKEQTVTILNAREQHQQTGAYLYNLETINFSDEIPDYGIRVRGPFNNTSIDLYAWYGDAIYPSATTDDNLGPLTLSALEQDMYRYNTRNGNVAARLSYHLPFLSILHQGMAPSVNIESSYRFDSQPSYEVSGSHKATDYSWQTGISYKGKNLINLPASPVGINWGIGYNYMTGSDNYDALENDYKSHNYHSGNIFAGSYWHNLKLYTMFMYRYDSQSNGGMATFSASFSPSLRWSYGIRANFYNNSNNINGKGINSNPEQVSFTATYRWD
jgi:hypothetical protein